MNLPLAATDVAAATRQGLITFNAHMPARH
jgi:hypothetical protein